MAVACKEPTDFYLLAVALRSFFLVLATHLLAGEVDTSLAGAALRRRLWWWCRYYNPLNLSWRYYSMLAYRFTARCWGTRQLALVNHEQHPLLPPLPYVVGETAGPLRVRRLELAGILSSQGVLTLSAAYQGGLAIRYAISTEGIPYLPNTTVPLAMVGLFRVMACKWVATKIHVDAFPYPNPNPNPNPCFPSSSTAQQPPPSSPAPTVGSQESAPPPAAAARSAAETLPSAIAVIPKARSNEPLAILALEINHAIPSFPDKSNTEILPNSAAISIQMHSMPPINLRLPSFHSPQTLDAAQPSSSPSVKFPSPTSRLLPPILSPPYSLLLSLSSHGTGSVPPAVLPTSETVGMPLRSSLIPPSSEAHVLRVPCPPSELQKTASSASMLCSTYSSTSHSSVEFAVHPQDPDLPPSSNGLSCGCEADASPSPLSTEQSLAYKSNKIVAGLWVAVLVSLVAMSILPYKVTKAYQLPKSLLQFSMQFFYQYIAVTEFVFHGYLLYQGPRALANRVIFFDHWAFKMQTAGFYCLLAFMLIVALLDFVKHGFYRTCA